MIENTSENTQRLFSPEQASLYADGAALASAMEAPEIVLSPPSRLERVKKFGASVLQATGEAYSKNQYL